MVTCAQMNIQLIHTWPLITNVYEAIIFLIFARHTNSLYFNKAKIFMHQGLINTALSFERWLEILSKCWPEKPAAEEKLDKEKKENL